MSVVGFDFGSESCVVSVARRRGIDVLQNEVGNRKTHSYVALTDSFPHHRLIGDEAKAQAMGNYKNTFCHMKRFMGRASDDADLAKELVFVPYKTVPLNGKIALEGTCEDKTEAFFPEQISAAMLVNLKGVAEKGLESRVTDCVIGVPVWWTDIQRRAMLDAATVAGLNVLRLMNETTAVALNYGILRPLPKDEANKVMFVDVGLTSTCVSVVSFVQGKLTVLSSAWDQHLGGRDFDKLLVDHFHKYILDKYKMDVLSNPKATLKLFTECERVKKILSANTKVNFRVEYIMNDTDVAGEIDRPTFEGMCSENLIPRITQVITRALASANVKPEELFSTEVVGGTTRVPIVQKLLGDFMGREVSKTCDSDESVARGCALQCAMLSPAFRVREFEVADIAPYAVEVAWGPLGDGAEMEQTSPLFLVNNPIPSVKMISFKDRTEPFQIVAKYSDPNAVAPFNPVIGRFQIAGMTHEGDVIPKIKVRVKMNMHGIVEVTSAQQLHVLPDEPEPEPEPEAPKAEEGAEPKAEGEATAEEAKPDNMDTAEDAAPEAAKEAAPEAAKEAGEGYKKDDAAPDATADEKKEAADAVEQAVKDKKKKVRREELKVSAQKVGGLTDGELKGCVEREGALALADKVVAETNEARNQLESYCLEMRSKAEDELKEFMDDATRETFCELCNTMEFWLEDHEDAQKSEVKAKYAELAKEGDAALKREQEFAGREAGVVALKAEITKWSQLAGSEDELYSHITAEERAKVTECCTAADAWLTENLVKQDKLAKHQDPSLTCAQLSSKASSVSKTCAPIMNKKKPPPPKPVEPEKKEGEEDNKDAPAADAAADADATAAAAAEEGADTAKGDTEGAGEPASEPAADATSEPVVDMEMD